MRIRLPLLLCLFAVSPSFGSQLVDNLRAGKDQTVVVYGTSLTAGGRWVTEDKALFEKYVSDGVPPTPEASSTVTFPQVKASLDEK